MSDVSSIFNRFAGRSIDVIEKQVTWKGAPRTVATVNLADPLVKEITDFAKAAGYDRVRLLTPDTIVTRDVRMDRVNMRAEKGADGKWRVGAGFKVG